MRLVTFEIAGERRIGMLRGRAVVDLTSSVPSIGDDMLELVRRFDPPVLERAATFASVRDLRDVRLLAPLRPPRNVIGVGRNYHDHAQEFSASGFDASQKQTVPDHPVVFTKATTSVIGPDEPIVLANDPSGTTDYEGELGVVVGRRCRNVRPEGALAHVFGWTIVNDVTARDLQRRHVQWFVGKSPDTFCPMGPCVVTREELPDIGASWLRTRVNGTLRQEFPIGALIFGVEALIATLSEVMTLEPGDVIATGTGRGVGIGLDPPVYLATGDVVEVAVDGIGTLRNPVV